MKIFAKTIVAASLASVAAIATPAAAQVAGIATSSPEAVIVRSQARINAYQQIDQQFASQITQLRTMRQEMQTLQQSLDTDSNGQISQAEAQANQSVVQQLQQKEQQLQQASQPIVLAQTYAIEQLINDYQNVQQQVVQRDALFQPAAEIGRLRGQVGIAQRLELGLHCVDLVDDLLEAFQLTFIAAAEKLSNDIECHEIPVKRCN